MGKTNYYLNFSGLPLMVTDLELCRLWIMRRMKYMHSKKRFHQKKALISFIRIMYCNRNYLFIINKPCSCEKMMFLGRIDINNIKSRLIIELFWYISTLSGKKLSLLCSFCYFYHQFRSTKCQMVLLSQ